MEVQVKPLLKLSVIDAPPKFLQSLQDAGKFVKKLRESDTDVVNSTANRSGTEEEHRALQAGLLYLALTEPDRRRSFCTDIVLTSRDNLTYVLSEMTRLVAETWPKMSQNVRVNLLSLLSEFVATRANVEVLMLHLYRRMSSGDLSSTNLWLIENVVELLEKNKDWLVGVERQTFLLPLTVLTLLRLIPDHFSLSNQTTQLSVPTSQSQTSLSSLRHRELILAEDLIRKHFDRCAQLGRELIRLLQGVARLEPMRTLWEDLLHNLPVMSSHFSDIAEVLEIPTLQCFTQTLIPHEMEQWVRWMMKNVHCVPRVPVNRYQEFFQRKFFSTPESQSLRVCLLRYIVTYFYPDNEMLASTLIPRWNVISWILSQSTCGVVTANAKLALFYDWLFFKPNDCIMNLEPALLAMMNHLTPRTQPIALSLVDFLVKIASSYHPPMTDRIVAGVRNGLEEMIRLGVVKTINPVLEMLNRVSPELLRAFRSLLNCDAPVVNSVGVDVTNRTVPGSEKPEPSEDGDSVPLSLSPLTAPVSQLTAHRPATPPLSGVIKQKQSGSDSGILTDPRLTRGHAAILAGAIPNLVSSNNADCSARSLLPNSDAPPDITVKGVSVSISSTASPAVIQNLSSVDDSRLKTQPKCGLLPVPITHTVPIKVVTSSHMDLSLSELDKLDVDGISDDDLRYTRASWSPPPLPPSQTVYRQRTEQLPETSESIELTIDNLRRRFQEYHLRYHYSVEPVDVNSLIEQLDGPVRTALVELRDLALRVELVRNTGSMVCADRIGDEREASLGDDMDHRSHSVRVRSGPVLRDLCDNMDSLVQAILSEDNFDDLEIAGRTASVVCELLFLLFAERLMPNGTEWSEEQLEDCLDFPIFEPFRHLWQMNPGDPKRELLLLLLTEMQTRQPRLGYHLLFFLKVGKLNDETMMTYRNFCASQENPNLRDSLFKDMQLLADDNRRLFAYLLPDVYTVFAAELTNDVNFLHLVVSTVDPGMCNTLICEIVRGHLNMFQSEDLSSVLKSSLRWNSIEQYFFWQLINAHEIPTRSFLPLVKVVDPLKHPEACANLILLFKLEKPSFELVRALLSRPSSNDALSVTALHFWSCPDNQHASRFASILKSMIMTPLLQRVDSSTVSGSGIRDARDRRRNGSKSQMSADNHVDLMLILTHLDSIRRNCKNISLLQDEDIQMALQEVVKSNKVALSIKDHFSDLLALAEDQPADSLKTTKPGISNGSHSPDSIHRLGSNLLESDDGKSLKLPSRSGGLGSKGGHSLRNLDSRRAAEAERRRLPGNMATAPGKRSSRVTNNQNCNDGGDSDNNDDSEAISLLSSSSEVSDDEEDRQPKATSERKKRTSRNTSPSGSRRADQLSSSKPGKRGAETTKERRSSAKRSLGSFDSTANSFKSDDEDEDDDKGLEVVVLDEDEEEDSGDEKNAADSDHIRPPKRRKTTSRRFVLDD